jgi:hypothetical protein
MFFQKIPLKLKIKNLIELYFGDSNYIKDDHLLSNRDQDGYVPIIFISNFKLIGLLKP